MQMLTPHSDKKGYFRPLNMNFVKMSLLQKHLCQRA